MSAAPTQAQLLEMVHAPACLGRLASQRRAERFGDEIWVRPRPALEPSNAHWPQPSELTHREDDCIKLAVDANPRDRAAYLQWLSSVASSLPANTSVAPYSAHAAGLHRLWCFAAARLLLPLAVRIELRHDVTGLRLAQLALGFGVDTFAGPLTANRKLPLAGVTRPDEATQAGLATLVREAGLRPVFDPNIGSATDSATDSTPPKIQA